MSQTNSPTRPSVLIVDDEPAVLEILEALLGDNFDVKATSAPTEAIELVKRNIYSAILTDLNMPSMRGLELILEIKRCSPAVPILVVSGCSRTDESVYEAFLAGALDLISKPFPETSELVAIVRKYIK